MFTSQLESNFNSKYHMFSSIVVLPIVVGVLLVLYYLFISRKRAPIELTEEDDVMGQDPTSIDDISTPNILKKTWDTTNTNSDQSFNNLVNIKHIEETKSDLKIQCHGSSLLSFSVTPNFIVFVYDESNDIYLFDLAVKKEIKVPLERGGFATCVQSNFNTELNQTFIFLCTDTIESGYCINKFQLLTNAERKLRKKLENTFSFNTNRDHLVEISDFQSWRHPGLICQIDCVRGKYLVTRCEDNDTCFILNAENGHVITKLSTGQFKTAMFASSPKFVVNASFMNIIKIYAFSDMIPQKAKHKNSKPTIIKKDSKKTLNCIDEKSRFESDLLYKCMELSGHKSSVQYVCISPNSEELVSVSNDGTMRLWTLQNWSNDNRCMIEKNLSDIMKDSQPTQCSMFLAWSPNTKWISFAFQNQIVLLNSSTLKEIFRVVSKSFITVLKWSENSKFVISGHVNGEANFWKIKEQKNSS